jgi:hypothetical protein
VTPFWVFFEGKLQSFTLTASITIGDILDAFAAETLERISEERTLEEPTAERSSESGDSERAAAVSESRLCAFALDDARALPPTLRLATLTPPYCHVRRFHAPDADLALWVDALSSGGYTHALFHRRLRPRSSDQWAEVDALLKDIGAQNKRSALLTRRSSKKVRLPPSPLHFTSPSLTDPMFRTPHQVRR